LLAQSLAGAELLVGAARFCCSLLRVCCPVIVTHT
jgi:hypothetical protein